jgi:hypothetical protein
MSKELLIKVMECLIDTAKRTTDLECVYDDSKGVNSQFVTWEEIDQAKQFLIDLDSAKSSPEKNYAMRLFRGLVGKENKSKERIMVVWNPEIVRSSIKSKEDSDLDLENYANVQLVEKKSMCSVSSAIRVHPDTSPEDLIQAIYNETNVDLKYVVI